MSAVGLQVYLGHAGDCCPRNSPSMVENLRVAETNGMHVCRIVYCKCRWQTDKHLQLIRNGLFPSSLKKPTLAFTMRLLNDFRTHTHASRKSAYDYMKSIRRKTDDNMPDYVEVRPWVLAGCIDTDPIQTPTSQFIRIARIWCYLSVQRSSGQHFSIDARRTYRPPGSLANICLACPIPGVNDFRQQDDVKP